MLFISLRHWHLVSDCRRLGLGFGAAGRTLVDYLFLFLQHVDRGSVSFSRAYNTLLLLNISHTEREGSWKLFGLNLDRQLGMISKGWKWPKPELPSEGCHEENVKNEDSLTGKMKDEAKSGTWSMPVRGMGALDSIQGDETKRLLLGSWNHFKWVEDILFFFFICNIWGFNLTF